MERDYAEIIIQNAGERLMFVVNSDAERSGGWMAWRPEERRWVKGGRPAAYNTASEALLAAARDRVDADLARAATRLRVVSGALQWAEGDMRVQVPMATLDADPLLINTPDGTWRWDPDEKRLEHAQTIPADRVTKCTNAGAGLFDPDSDLLSARQISAAWVQFVEQLLPDPEVRAFVKRAVGYSLTGLNDEQAAFVLLGPPAAGKSTFVDVIVHVLGGYGHKAAKKLLEGSEIPTEVADLQGRRFAIVNEPNKIRIDLDRFNDLVSTGLVSARRMRENYETFENVAKLWLTTNELPDTQGNRAALRRLHVIRFDREIPLEEQNRTLGRYMKSTDADAVLAWCLEGLADYMNCGGLRPPASVAWERERWRDLDGLTQRFVDERLEVAEGERLPLSECWRAYQDWAARDVDAHRSQRRLNSELEVLGLVKGKSGVHFWMDRRIKHGLNF